jgi:hypothetical protein
MKEAPDSSETSVLTRATRRKNPEDTILHSHRRENLKSYNVMVGYRKHRVLWSIRRRKGENNLYDESKDCLCRLEVRVPGYKPRGARFNSRSRHIFWEATGLERGTLNLVRNTEISRCMDPLGWPSDTLLPATLSTKICRPAAAVNLLPFNRKHVAKMLNLEMACSSETSDYFKHTTSSYRRRQLSVVRILLEHFIVLESRKKLKIIVDWRVS